MRHESERGPRGDLHDGQDGHDIEGGENRAAPPSGSGVTRDNHNHKRTEHMNNNNDEDNVASINRSGVSSLSSPFQSTSSVGLPSTGHPAFDQDLIETMEYFDCQVDNPYEDERGKLFSVLIKLPCYGQLGRSRDFCYLRAIIRPRDNSYIARYSIEKRSMGMETIPDKDINKILRKAHQYSRQTCHTNYYHQHYHPSHSYSNQQTEENNIRPRRRLPSLICFIDSFYYVLEEYWHPGKTVMVRDFCYSVYDPRHWGRPLPSLLERLGDGRGNFSFPASTIMMKNGGAYRAIAKFDFKAATPDELSISKGEKLYVLADFGNGWVSVRKLHANSSESSTDKRETSASGIREMPPIGLVPEYYVQRAPA